MSNRIQPSDIGDILHTKYGHRKHEDELGFTGHFNLAPREVLDIIIDLDQIHTSQTLQELKEKVEQRIKSQKELRETTSLGVERTEAASAIYELRRVLQLIEDIE